MLLTIDIGNTNTVLGIYQGDTLVDHLRIESRRSATSDEYSALVGTLLAQRNVPTDAIKHAIIGSVVPPLTAVFEGLCKRWLGHPATVVGPGIRTGMPILYDNPREVGADRIVNAIAAYERCKRACIVVDFGTATTFDVISGRGEYLGGVIVPGVGISADALFNRAAKLPRVDVAKPRSVIGKTTVDAIQSGLVFGYVGLVEGLVRRISAELGESPAVIATGGLAPLISAETTIVDEVIEFLTLDGLRMVWTRNSATRGGRT
ncbi:MAG: type III pantothenate kinase [Myxococcales bacterium]|nr:type III pantothenate kinase [Myxococcales bacterium]